MIRQPRFLVQLIAILTLAFGGCGSADHASHVDRQFVAAMIPHHELGVELLEHAMPRVVDVRVRRLVFEMSGYHGAELNELHDHAAHVDHDTPSRFPGWIAPDRLDALTSLSGISYDVGWLELMIEHHEGAVELSVHQMAAGHDPDLTRMASRIEETQRAEIDEMRGLLAAFRHEGARN